MAIKSLLHPGFYTSHDGKHQIIRLMHYHQGLKDSQLPVRWAGTALKGYGYPLFVFTYRLPFWIAEVGYLIMGNLGDAIKFSFILTYLVSGITMFVFAKKLWSSKLAGFLSAVLYLWAPYRFVNIFVRASLGEAAGFVFIPLIFFGLNQLAEIRKKYTFWILLLSFSLSGLILTHAITLGLWAVPILFWFTINVLLTKNKKEYCFMTALSGIISLFLTAYYWLPAMIEKKYVKISGVFSSYYKAHFVTLQQLFYSKWGYGFSMPGVKDDSMSFQVGIAQWLVILISLTLILLKLSLYVFKNTKFKKFYQRHIKFRQNFLFFGTYFLMIFWFSIFLMLTFSNGLYEFINDFFVIDIPWRFLGIAIFASSLLIGFTVKVIKNSWYKWFLIFLILFLGFYGNRNHLKVNKYVYFPDSEYWQSTETSSEYEDYAPRHFPPNRFDQSDPQIVTLSGNVNSKILEKRSNLIRFYSEVKSDKAEIIPKLVYYPGWQIYINGQKKNINQMITEDGRIRIKLDKGNHLITLVFRETNLRRFSNWLSLLSLIGFGLIYYKYDREKK